MNESDDKNRLINDDASEEDEVMPEFIQVTDVLDLHGFFPEQAPEMVDEFLKNAIRLNLEVVRIIHGKGKSKMKWTVHQILKGHSLVLEFKDAPPEFGGWGATVVLLKMD